MRKEDWDTLICAYNAGVASLVTTRLSQGKRVALVDMYHGFATDQMWFKDQTHPNEAGYEFMATVWYRAISGHLA
jgi:lysophospholipase L1-like esterase